MPEPQYLRVFLSSPGDVADERGLARRLLKDELPYDPFLRGRVTFDVVSWDGSAGANARDADTAGGRKPGSAQAFRVRHRGDIYFG
jgi:hypothetical protein